MSWELWVAAAVIVVAGLAPGITSFVLEGRRHRRRMGEIDAEIQASIERARSRLAEQLCAQKGLR